jgi:hypothetical protein
LQAWRWNGFELYNLRAFIKTALKHEEIADAILEE